MTAAKKTRPFFSMNSVTESSRKAMLKLDGKGI